MFLVHLMVFCVVAFRSAPVHVHPCLLSYEFAAGYFYICQRQYHYTGSRVVVVYQHLVLRV